MAAAPHTRWWRSCVAAHNFPVVHPHHGPALDRIVSLAPRGVEPGQPLNRAAGVYWNLGTMSPTSLAR